jgi:hypothetical protein
MVVLDASVVVKWIFPDRAEESHSFQTLHILQAIKESRILVVQPVALTESGAILVTADDQYSLSEGP